MSVQYLTFLKPAIVNSVSFGRNQVAAFDSSFDPTALYDSDTARESTEPEVTAYLEDEAELASPHGNPRHIPAGGAVDQILAKRSEHDFDTEWRDNESSPGEGGLESVTGTGGITVDDADPANPVVSGAGLASKSSVDGATATGKIIFNGIPTDGQFWNTLNDYYQLAFTPTGDNINDVLIGATIEECVDNSLAYLINGQGVADFAKTGPNELTWTSPDIGVAGNDVDMGNGDAPFTAQTSAGGINGLAQSKADLDYVQSELGNRPTNSTVNSALALKADITYVDEAVAGASGSIKAYKSSATVRSNNDVVAADPVLKVPLVNGKFYKVEVNGEVDYFSGGFRIGFGDVTGAALILQSVCELLDTTNHTSSKGTEFLSAGLGGGRAIHAFRMTAFVLANSADCVFGVLWAQNSSDAAYTAINGFSSITATEMTTPA